MKKVLILAVSIALTWIATAQQTQPVKMSDKNMYTNGTELISILKALGGGSATPLYAPEFSFDDEGNFLSGRFSTYEGSDFTRGKPRRSCSDTIGFYFFNDFRKVPNLYFDWFIGTEYSLEWENDKITAVTINRDWHDINHDEHGKVIKIRKRFGRYIDEYLISYNSDGKIAKIEQRQENRNDKGKLLYANLKKSTSYIYNKNEIIATESNYYEGKKPKDNTLENEQIYTYRKTPNGYVNEIKSTINNNLRNPSTLDTNSQVVEYEIANHRVTKKISYQKNTPQFTNTTTYAYDEMGFVAKIENVSKSDTYFSHNITTYTYELKSPEADPKLEESYKMSYFGQSFDENGEVIAEERDGKQRRKDENGNWGAWGGFIL